ncbi:MAG: hypothetical protein AB4062_08725 [Crocosphaera sp.]
MIKAIKQKAIVNKQGKIEIHSPELQERSEVEIIILVSSPETDTTEYLLSTKANEKELLEAIERVEKREEMITITPEEWHEKYSI